MLTLILNQENTIFLLSVKALWEYRFDIKHFNMQIEPDENNPQRWISIVNMSDFFAEKLLYHIDIHIPLFELVNFKVRSRVNNGQWDPKNDLIR